jgi:hypothetical protein
MSSVVSGSLRLNANLMVLLTDTKHVLLPKVLSRDKTSIMRIHLALLLKLPLYD